MTNMPFLLFPNKSLLVGFFFLFFAIHSGNALATACSPHIGTATLNEVYKLGGESWLEVKLLDVNANYTNWKIRVCSNVCSTYPIGSLDLSNQFYLVQDDTDNRIDLRSNASMNALLLDENNLAIDYVSVNNHASHIPACTNFLYPTGAVSASSIKGIFRFPDGTGAWNELPAGGASAPPTKGGTNDGMPGTAALHHLRLLHSGQGITCQAEPVTLRACANIDCTSLYTDAVTVELTSPALGWTPNPTTFSGGETSVQLQRSVAGSVTLNATSSAANPTQCVNSSGGTPCELIFTDVGILIDGDEGDPALNSNIPMQLTGKPSNVGYNAATQRVRVVRTDTQTGACIPGLANQTIAAAFSYLVPTASEGIADNTIGIDGASSTNLTAAGSSQTVQLEFDGNGTAPFSFTSQDAGRYQIRVAMGIPVTDRDGNPTGDTIAASDTSNTFLARPLAVFADATGNPQAQNADDDAYRKAGEAFSMTFHSLRWAAGRDNNNDGLWDSCGSTDLTDPGNYSRVPVWEIGQPAADLALPSGGSNPGLNYADGNGNIGFSAGTSTVTAYNVSYDEVGIVQLQTNGMNNFFGAAVGVCSPYIGRFIPAQFVIEPGNILNRASIPSCSSSFTYMGEPFEAELNLAAKNVSGDTTANYRGDFARLNDGSLNIGAIDRATTSTPLTDRLNATVTHVSDRDWGDDPRGEADYTLSLYIAREASPDGSFDDVAIGINPLDDDGVVLGTLNLDINDDGTYTHGILGSTIIRYGRLRLQNAHGSELLALAVTFVTEYYTGDYFITNTDDSCTNLNLASHLQLRGPSDTVWQSGDTPISIESGQTSASILYIPLSNGDAGLSLSSPGDGNTGAVDLRSNISTDYPWLLYDWNGDGSHDNEAQGRATFGIYQGSDRKIYMRERY